MKLGALVATVFVFLAACSTADNIISADEHHITIEPRSNVFFASDQIPAAETTANAHCAKHGKTAVYLLAARERFGERRRFRGGHSVVTFACR